MSRVAGSGIGSTADDLNPRCSACGTAWRFMSDHGVVFDGSDAPPRHLCLACLAAHRDAAKAAKASAKPITTNAKQED